MIGVSAAERGSDIPSDLSVIGIDEPPEARHEELMTSLVVHDSTTSLAAALHRPG